MHKAITSNVFSTSDIRKSAAAGDRRRQPLTKLVTVLAVLVVYTITVLPAQTAPSVMPYSQAENTVGFMSDWPNPDPCDGDCSSSVDFMERAESSGVGVQFVLV